MKTRYLQHALFIVCAIGGLSGVSPAFSEDNIQRSCKAHYTVVLSPQSQYGEVSLPMMDYAFSARRGCGRTVPNRCRKRALEAIKQCMDAHATAPATMPAACTSNGVENYRITNLRTAIRETVCGHLRNTRKWDGRLELRNIPYSLWGEVSGGEGCYKHDPPLNYFETGCLPR